MSLERLVERLVNKLMELDAGVSIASTKANQLSAINRGLSSLGVGRLPSLSDIGAVRRALASVERMG